MDLVVSWGLIDSDITLDTLRNFVNHSQMKSEPDLTYSLTLGKETNL